MKRYRLLEYHINCNPTYLYGHQQMQNIITTNEQAINTYKIYCIICRALLIKPATESIYHNLKPN